MTAVANHPECRRGFLNGVYGPVEKRHRIILTEDRGVWNWRYKLKGETHYIHVGPVSRFPAPPFQEIRIIELLADIY